MVLEMIEGMRPDALTNRIHKSKSNIGAIGYEYEIDNRDEIFTIYRME